MHFKIPGMTTLKAVLCPFRKITPFLECLVWKSDLCLHPLIKRTSSGMFLSFLLSLCFSWPTTQFVNISATRAPWPHPTIKKVEYLLIWLWGWRSYFLICHLQELGVHISGTLPFWVEQELVIAAISTNRCTTQRNEREVVSKHNLIDRMSCCGAL